MNKGYLGAVLLAAISLAACGGGGSSNGGPIPNPGPSATPGTKSVVLTWQGPGHSVLGAASVRVMTNSVSAEPIEVAPKPPCVMGALGCNSINANTNFNMGSLQVSVVDSSGSPVPEPSPPSVTSADPNTASVAPLATQSPSGTATPGPAAFAVDAQAGQQAQTTVSATYADGTSGSLSAKVYDFAGFEYPTPQDQDAAVGYVLQGGKLVAVSDISTADISIQAINGTTSIFAKNGLAVLAGTTQIGNVTSALPYSSTGTSVAVSSLVGSDILFPVGSQYILLKFGVEQCTYTTTASTCDKYAMLGGIYKVSDTSGNFSS